MQVPGLNEAERLYGKPETRSYQLGEYGDLERFWEMWRNRQAEVIMVLRRPNGHLILQTKAFYPAGAFRLPTGGIKEGEDLLCAVRRETWEETGLAIKVVRFLGILRYRFRRAGQQLERTSFVFLLQTGPDEPQPQDESEEITAFREIPPEDLNAVATHLEAFSGEWAPWGRFRALGHRFVAEKLGVICDT